MENLSHKNAIANPLNWDRFSTTVILEVIRGERTYTSTGVLLDGKTLLTAAHSIDCADQVKVILTHDYHFSTESYSVERCYIHPEYKPSSSLYENDVAVLILKDKIEQEFLFDDIPLSTTLNHSSVLERIGFGQRGNTNKRTWTNPKFTELNFSKKAFVLNDRYSFTGDSGGPIYQNIRGERQLIALHSTKEGADRTYAVNLSYFKNWIDAVRVTA